MDGKEKRCFLQRLFFLQGEEYGEDEQNYQPEPDEYEDQLKDTKGKKRKKLKENHYSRLNLQTKWWILL